MSQIAAPQTTPQAAPPPGASSAALFAAGNSSQAADLFMQLLGEMFTDASPKELAADDISADEADDADKDGDQKDDAVAAQPGIAQISLPLALLNDEAPKPADDGEAGAKPPADVKSSDGKSAAAVSAESPAAPEIGDSAPQKTERQAADGKSVKPDFSALVGQTQPEGKAEVKPAEAAKPAAKTDAIDPALAAAKPQAPAATAAAQAPAAIAQAAAPQAHPVHQVALQLHRAGGDKVEALTIKLQPEGLGSVHVRLEFGDKGAVRAVIAADKPETLELLLRDQRGLEKALEQAGLKPDAASLNFTLSDHQGRQPGESHRHQADGGSHFGLDGEGVEEDADAVQPATLRIVDPSRLDLSV